MSSHETNPKKNKWFHIFTEKRSKVCTRINILLLFEIFHMLIGFSHRRYHKRTNV